ncbi:MAG: hypothetical protein FWC47_15680 [Oscillospiraceae bacterium]|nr:hypothetical protein [Oscillospiraceae bacterium]
MDISKSDCIILEKILENLIAITDERQELGVKRSADLSRIKNWQRMGFSQAVINVSELYTRLDDQVASTTQINRLILKKVRDTAAHNYGALNDVFLFTTIDHLSDKNVIKQVRDLISGKYSK